MSFSGVGKYELLIVIPHLSITGGGVEDKVDNNISGIALTLPESTFQHINNAPCDFSESRLGAGRCELT